MKRNFIPFFTLLCLGVASLGANPVLFWNDQVLNATRLSRNPPPIAALHLATYHAAIFDAINGFDRAYEPWLVDEAAPTGADRDAAIAAAAYTVLQAIWGNEVNPRVLRKAYDEALAGIAEGEAKSAGITWGKHVAQRLLDNRSESGLNQPYAGAITSEKAGKWRETPPAFRPPRFSSCCARTPLRDEERRSISRASPPRFGFPRIRRATRLHRQSGRP
jgi:hypothetical protein